MVTSVQEKGMWQGDKQVLCAKCTHVRTLTQRGQLDIYFFKFDLSRVILRACYTIDDLIFLKSL